jgi:hypothetical protein
VEVVVVVDSGAQVKRRSVHSLIVKKTLALALPKFVSSFHAGHSPDVQSQYQVLNRIS